MNRNEYESDIASGLVLRKFDVLFASGSDKGQRKMSLSLSSSFSVNEPLGSIHTKQLRNVGGHYDGQNGGCIPISARQTLR